MHAGLMQAGLKAKHQRLILAVMALAALIAAGLLAAWALRNQASYFYVPSDITAKPPTDDRIVRLGGMVERGSIKRQADGVTITFIVGDGKARVPVRFTGITPELFVEGSGVVAEGRLSANRVFVAETLLAKHDEKYVPRELKDMTAAQARKAVEQTK